MNYVGPGIVVLLFVGGHLGVLVWMLVRDFKGRR